MRNILIFFVCYLTVCSIYSQSNITPNIPVPEDIVLSYQNEIKDWFKQNRINLKEQSLIYNGIELFIEPNVFPIGPEMKVFGKCGSIIECFAGGKFLTIMEKEKLYVTAYSCIPENDIQNFSPFASFEKFTNSLIFNPNLLFGSTDYGLNSDFKDNYAYLIFYFGSNYEWYTDSVFDIQFNQL